MFTIGLFCVFLYVISRLVDQKFKIRRKLKFLFAYIYVWFLKKSTPLPFDSHNRTAIEKYAVVATPEAWTLECPRTLQSSIHASDTLAFCGVNSNGSILVTKITRRHNRIAETWVYLRLPSGEEYELPNHPDTKIYNISDNKFSAGGLTFELLEPIKRWRVIFNGFLRRRILAEWDNSDNDTVEVTFNFIWHPMYGYVAFPQDFTISFLADISSARRKEFINFSTIFPEESIEIFGHMHGELKIENQKEIILELRGLRERKYGILNWEALDNKLCIKGVLNNGRSFHLFGETNKANQLSYLYGYILQPCNTSVQFVEKFSTETRQLLLSCEDQPKNLSINFSAGNKNYVLKISCDDAGFLVREGNEWEKQISIRPVNITLNDKEGRGLIECTSRYSGYYPVPMQRSFPLLREPDISHSEALVVNFTDVECRSSKIVGGKGASLANMLSVPNNLYTVPLGVCLTRAAFELHLQDNPSIMEAILHMQNVAWKKISGSLSDECDRVVKTMNEVTRIPEELKKHLLQKLLSVFGEDFQNMRFAVRSSAIGEDGDEMSAAGQNETFLGIKGFDNICSSVLKCWTSQFAYRSIEYKRQNGQLLNSGMGVVLQVMVPADVSGVLFSRDPLTGSRTKMLISSNFGLGESVVSASADPDSVSLRRSWNDELSVLTKEIGSKRHMITIVDEGGVAESEVDKDKATTFTVPDKLAIKLGQIAVFQEKCFGSARDIEWALRGNEIFLLQSRPVTVDNVISDFEIMHEFDSSPKTDQERATSANVGEVLPGAMSPLGMSSTIRILVARGMELLNWKDRCRHFDLTVLDGWFFYYNHCFLDQVQQKFSGKKSVTDKAFDVALYGRVLDDSEILEMAKDRFENPPIKANISLIGLALKGMLFGHTYLKHTMKEYENYPDPTIGVHSIKDMYDAIGRHLEDQRKVMDTHVYITCGSSIWNLIILSLLSQGSDDYNVDQYTDFAKIIGTGIGAESGNVPYSLQTLANTIAQEVDPKKFSNWSVECALQWLKVTSTQSKLKFNQFLARHGHRGVKEFDVMTTTWGMNPTGVIKILQDILRLPDQQISEQSNNKDDLSGLKTPLSSFRRILLRLVMNGSRIGVCQREKSKSLLIKYYDGMRMGYRRLAETMVANGFVPDANLIFFLTHEEVQLLLNTRSAKLLRRAKHRFRLHEKLDTMKFPEMMVGFPLPINKDDEETTTEVTDSVTGYPVSQGVIKGPAKVIKTFHEIHTIQPGDILITYSTDIGWSPYFPILSGVVTEIGGLISHGAVVAREFGLPCIVGAKKATNIFKNGDMVILDANKGILSKLHSTISQVD